MTNANLYGLAIRIAGLYGMMKVINHWGRFWHRQHYLIGGDHTWEFIAEIILFVIGIIMVLAAPTIIRWLRLDANSSPK